MSHVVSLQIGRIRHLQEPIPWTTATFKESVPGPILLATQGFAGDQQADRRYHGGPDKAALAYSYEHYAAWLQDGPFSSPLPPGAFGENLLISGQSEQNVCIGDIYRLGHATVQVSQPRQPCAKQARRWGVKDLVVQMRQKDRSGWYLRVLEPGDVSPGDPLSLLERPHPEWPLHQANRVMYLLKNDPAATAALIACPPLSEDWKKELRARL